MKRGHFVTQIANPCDSKHHLGAVHKKFDGNRALGKKRKGKKRRTRRKKEIYPLRSIKGHSRNYNKIRSYRLTMIKRGERERESPLTRQTWLSITKGIDRKKETKKKIYSRRFNRFSYIRSWKAI